MTSESNDDSGVCELGWIGVGLGITDWQTCKTPVTEGAVPPGTKTMNREGGKGLLNIKNNTRNINIS